MNPKPLLTLLGVFVVLLGLAYVTGVFEGDASTVEVPTVDIASDDLQHVQITWPDQALAMQRQGTRWLLTEPVEALADSVTAARFIEDLGALQFGSIASNNPDRYARYGVDSTARVVEVEGSDGARRLVIGNQGADYQSLYVRLDDDPRVYVTRERINLPDEVDRWRDKVILHMPPGSVITVTAEGPDQTFDVQKDPAGWQLNQAGTPAPADSAAVSRWLQRFAPMRADGFLDDLPPAIVRDNSTYRLTFTTTAGVTETLHVLEQIEAVAVATASGPTTYRLTATRLNTFFPDPASLK